MPSLTVKEFLKLTKLLPNIGGFLFWNMVCIVASVIIFIAFVSKFFTSVIKCFCLTVKRRHLETAEQGIFYFLLFYYFLPCGNEIVCCLSVRLSAKFNDLG